VYIQATLIKLIIAGRIEIS